MGRFRMIAADLDGTLRVERQPTSARVRLSIARAHGQGVRVVLATGRTLLTTQPFVKELGLRDAVICDQGATVRDIRSGQVLRQEIVPLELAEALLAYAVKKHYGLVVCVGDQFFTPELSQEVYHFVGDFQDHLSVPNNWQTVLAQGPQKLTFVNDPATTDIILNELRNEYGTRLQVVQSYTHYVEVTHPGVSKGRAVEFLAARWGVQREEVLSIGDQDNDRSMIEWAGLGVAMGNAVPALKALAGFVALPVDQDGAAIVIEQFVLD